MELNTIDYGWNDKHKTWTRFNLGPLMQEKLCFYTSDHDQRYYGTVVGSNVEEPYLGGYRLKAAVENWLNENCKGEWKFFQIKVVFELVFEDANDAMRFKLIWS